MGNTTSSTSDTDTKITLKKAVDEIAVKYILTENFTDMKQLANVDYCNELVVITADILNKKLTEIEIEYLAQKTEQGEDINKMTEDNIRFFKKNKLDNIDVQNQSKKRRMCVSIAKYYIKIAHLFAAIATTINPVFSYNKQPAQPHNPHNHLHNNLHNHLRKSHKSHKLHNLI